jgi:phosphoribosylformylglycinamidine synthase
MTSPLAIVTRAAGTNCDAETVRALELAGARVELIHIKQLLAEPQRLASASLCVFPGGFSYGDDIAAGRVYGLDLRTGLHAELRAFIDAGGLLLGICNGFQILVESGILDPPQSSVAPTDPGTLQSSVGREIALHANASNRFECRWIELEAGDSACVWLEEGQRIPCPSAHAEGRFVVRDDSVLARLGDARQLALRYVVPTEGDTYPANPNGSIDHIAGICDPSGRALGLMPHPERNVLPWNHPQWTRRGSRSEGEGLAFFHQMVAAATPVSV